MMIFRNFVAKFGWSLGVPLGVLVAVLGLPTLFVFVFASGMISRGDWDFWVWDHFNRVGWHGWTSAMDAYAYAVFYLSLVAIPRFLLYVAYSECVPEHERRQREQECWIASLWVAATFVLFHRSIFTFFLAIPGSLSALPTWAQLLVLLWVAVTVVAIGAWRRLARMKRAYRRSRGEDA